MSQYTEGIRRRYAAAGLNKRSTEAEVRAYVNPQGLPNRPNDRDFEYSLHEIETMEQALAFLDELDADAKKVEWPGSYQEGTKCTKASVARGRLAKPFWRESSDSIRSALASSRRTCCGCHQRCSYAIRVDIYPTSRALDLLSRFKHGITHTSSIARARKELRAQGSPPPQEVVARLLSTARTPAAKSAYERMLELMKEFDI